MLGYESAAVNDQLVNVAPGQAFAPLTFGQMYTGPGMWPRNGVYNTPPVTPSPGTWEGSAVGLAGGAGGSPPTPTQAGVSNDGSVNWFHPTKSPVIFGALFFIVGILLLQFVHYR